MGHLSWRLTSSQGRRAGTPQASQLPEASRAGSGDSAGQEAGQQSAGQCPGWGCSGQIQFLRLAIVNPSLPLPTPAGLPPFPLSRDLFLSIQESPPLAHSFHITAPWLPVPPLYPWRLFLSFLPASSIPMLQSLPWLVGFCDSSSTCTQFPGIYLPLRTEAGEVCP